MYRDPTTKSHFPKREDQSFTGTLRFASRAAHQGQTQSRRDDLESLGFMAVFLLVGRLPWQGIADEITDEDEQHEALLEAKTKALTSGLLDRLPAAFRRYFEDLESTQYEEEPNYSGLRRHFKELYIERGYAADE